MDLYANVQGNEVGNLNWCCFVLKDVFSATKITVGKQEIEIVQHHSVMLKLHLSMLSYFSASVIISDYYVILIFQLQKFTFLSLPEKCLD